MLGTRREPGDSHILEAHQALALFVPEREPDRGEGRAQAKRRFFLKGRHRLVAAVQTIIRDSRREMVDVVKSDIAGEPMKDLRQLQDGRAFQGGAGEAPLALPRPVRFIEAMLN